MRGIQATGIGMLINVLFKPVKYLAKEGRTSAYAKARVEGKNEEARKMYASMSAKQKKEASKKVQKQKAAKQSNK